MKKSNKVTNGIPYTCVCYISMKKHSSISVCLYVDTFISALTAIIFAGTVIRQNSTNFGVSEK